MLEKPQGRKRLFIISVVFHPIPAGQNVEELSDFSSTYGNSQQIKEIFYSTAIS